MVFIGVTSLLASGEANPKIVVWTGWFSDSACATPRVKNGVIAPTNPECSNKCIEKGEAAVFISEQEKDLFRIKHYPQVTDDLGYHVELTGTVDDATKTVIIASVKRLEYRGASCARPKKSSHAATSSSTGSATLPRNTKRPAKPAMTIETAAIRKAAGYPNRLATMPAANELNPTNRS